MFVKHFIRAFYCLNICAVSSFYLPGLAPVNFCPSNVDNEKTGVSCEVSF